VDVYKLMRGVSIFAFIISLSHTTLLFVCTAKGGLTAADLASCNSEIIF